MSYRPYLATSAINKTIPAGTPVHPDSAKMISTANNWLNTGTWLGPRPRPTYFRGDTSKLPRVTMYANGNGWVGAGPFSMPMPSWAAGVIGPHSAMGDSHVVIVDDLTGDVWELWHCTPPGYPPRNSGFPSSRWNCSAYRHWAADTTTKKGYGPPSQSFVPGTSASQIHIAAGLLVPDDFLDCFDGKDPGTVIPHVLRVGTFCGSNNTAHPKFVHPAYGGDGRQPEGIPMGAIIQLDPSRDYSSWPSVAALREPWRSAQRKLLRTYQVHGMVHIDSFGGPGGGNIDCIRPEAAAKGGPTWPVGWKYPNEVAGYGWGVANGVPEDLMSHFHVLDWRVTSTWA